MTFSTDRLFYWARLLGITVMFADLPAGLLGQADADTKTIILDRTLKSSARQFRCVLAEEIGHILHPPRPGHLRYHSKNYWQMEDRSSIKHIVAQDERKALDWATGVLMPDVEFTRIMEAGNYSVSEIAELFEVEPWAALHKIGYYRRKADRRVKWCDIIRRV